MPDLPISGLSSGDPASTALVPVVVNSTTMQTTLDEAVGFWSTAPGDLVYAAAARNLARLAIGTSGRYLRVSTVGLPTWLPDRWRISVQFNAAAASQTICVPVPVNASIDEWHMVLSTGPSSAVGSATVEVRVDNRSSTPAASGSQISSGQPAALANTNDGGATALASWTSTNINVDQWFTFYLAAVSSADTVAFTIGGNIRSS